MTGVTPPTVTVIVPVRNEARSLRACLGSLLAQTYPAERLEILVVDGLSEDGTAALAREIAGGAAVAVRVLPNPRRTAAAAMNAGVREARGDVIVRLDGHAEAAPDFVERSVEALRRTGADCVGGPIATVGEGATGRAIALAMSSRFGAGGAAFRTGRDREAGVDTVAFPAYRRDVFARAGLFDETLARNQDDEFHLRLTRAGGRIVLAPEIRTTYRCRGTFAALARQYFDYGRWKPRLLARHGRLPALRAFAPPALVAALAAGAAAALATRDPRWLLAVAAPYAAANAVASCVAAARGGPGVATRLPVAFATLHLAYGAGFLSGLVAPPPRQDERERIRRVFERRDAAPSRPLGAERADARRHEVRALLAAHGATPRAARRVLDVGCGRGDSLAAFDEANGTASTYGVDLLPSRVAAARERRPRARFAVADAGVLPFRDAAFDVCTLFTVLSSIRDPDLRRHVAAETLRVLRPGGAVLVHEFSWNPLNRDVRGVRRSELPRLFPGCRVTARATRGPFRWLPTHYIALVRRTEGGR
jgi:succinoglycan biosynthesis protein ExoA